MEGLPEATQEGWSRDLTLSSSDARTTIGPGHHCSCSWAQAGHPWARVTGRRQQAGSVGTVIHCSPSLTGELTSSLASFSCCLKDLL